MLMNFRRLWLRVAAGAVAAACASVLLAIAGLLFDLYAFEWSALATLVGPSGFAVAALVAAGVLVLGAWTGTVAAGRTFAPRRAALVVLTLAGLAFVWTADWMFVSRPLTARAGATSGATAVLAPDAQADFESFSLARIAGTDAARGALRTMYARVLLNNPDAYARHPIAATIDRRATETGVDPAAIFFLTYADSFYGEASAGPVPFMRALTPETVRDLVQLHLPAWFVEGRFRTGLASWRGWDRLVGADGGFKMRYAFHKMTLDVSLQPYALNTFTDVFLVLQEHPESFPDVFGPAAGADPLRSALRDSFLKLRGTALRRPYEDAYAGVPLDGSYYAAHRDDLKRYARASAYVTLTDFDFATRVQALLSRYHAEYYRARLGNETWTALPDWQRAAMLVMIRDLYTENVGRIGYDVYALPEINCSPVAFVAAAAVAERARLTGPSEMVWRPTDYEKLWGGASYRLRVFNEVWATTHGAPMPGRGVKPTETVDESLAVLRLHGRTH